MGLAGLAKRLFDRRAHLSPEELRKAIPVRNPLVEIESESDAVILLRVPLKDVGTGFTAWLARKRDIDACKHVELEQFGAFVWRLCDGKHTFEGISRKLREEFKMKRVETDASLGAFLQMLSQRHLITLMVKGQK